MHIFSKVKRRRGGWGLPSIIIYLEEIIFNNNNNHLIFWDIPFQPREEFSRRGLLPPILGGIFNLVILRTSALPNPRYPALFRQDTSYTWTLADRCYQPRLHSRRRLREVSLPSCAYGLQSYGQLHRRPKKPST